MDKVAVRAVGICQREAFGPLDIIYPGQAFLRPVKIYYLAANPILLFADALAWVLTVGRSSKGLRVRGW